METKDEEKEEDVWQINIKNQLSDHTPFTVGYKLGDKLCKVPARSVKKK